MTPTTEHLAPPADGELLLHNRVSDRFEAIELSAPPTDGEGWLILRVALPRLVRRLDHVWSWVERHERVQSSTAVDGLGNVAASEGLALLAAIPPGPRQRAIDRVELTEQDRAGLKALANHLGEVDDPRSPAAALVRMYPSVLYPALEVPGDDVRAIAAWVVKAEQEYTRGDFREVLELTQRALAVVRRIQDSDARVLEGEALTLLSNAYLTLGQPQQAIECFQQNLAIAREVGDRHGESHTLGRLGIAYKNLEQPQRAIECFQQNLAIARATGDHRSEGCAIGNLGVAYADLGQPHQAIDFYHQRLAIARDIGDREGEGNTLGNLGTIYSTQLGQPQRAIEFYQQSLAIARDIGDRQGEANTSWNMGLALSKLNRLAEALPLQEFCLAFLSEIGHPDADRVATLVENIHRQLQNKAVAVGE